MIVLTVRKSRRAGFAYIYLCSSTAQWSELLCLYTFPYSWNIFRRHSPFNKQIPRSRVLEKVMVPQLLIFPAFLRTRTSIMLLRKMPPFSLSCARLIQLTLSNTVSWLFNIILQSTPRSSRGLCNVSLPKPLYISLHSHSCYTPRLFYSPWFFHPNIIGREL